MYRIKMLCYDPGETYPYADEPAVNAVHPTKEKAYQAAFDMAEAEAESLNEGCDTQVSFGVAEYPEAVAVEYYYLENDGDTTGNTETVTVYYFTEE